MFSRNSRYSKLADTSALNAGGEWISGKVLRIIPETPGQFLHTVSASDRLDLLAYKYYGDSTKWWQICDANPSFPFPTHLLDGTPLIDETYTLEPKDFFARYRGLVEDLQSLDGVCRIIMPSPQTFGGESLSADPDFTGSVLIAQYDPTPAARKDIIGKIKGSFDFLGSFAWLENAGTADAAAVEAFTFEDRKLKEAWNGLAEILGRSGGILEVRSSVTEKTVGITYNSAMIEKETVLNLIRAKGFEPDIASAPVRTGASITVPPNRIL